MLSDKRAVTSVDSAVAKEASTSPATVQSAPALSVSKPAESNADVESSGFDKSKERGENMVGPHNGKLRKKGKKRLGMEGAVDNESTPSSVGGDLDEKLSIEEDPKEIADEVKEDVKAAADAQKVFASLPNSGIATSAAEAKPEPKAKDEAPVVDANISVADAVVAPAIADSASESFSFGRIAVKGSVAVLVIFAALYFIRRFLQSSKKSAASSSEKAAAPSPKPTPSAKTVKGPVVAARPDNDPSDALESQPMLPVENASKPANATIAVKSAKPVQSTGASSRNAQSPSAEVQDIFAVSLGSISLSYFLISVGA